MRGIADGAKLQFAEVLLVNVRAEVMGVRSDDAANHSPDRLAARGDGCTAFALGRTATADGEIVAGQNLDQDPLNADLLIMLRVEPDDAPPALMCTFAGLVGYPGINAAGIAVFQNALSTSDWRPHGMPHYLLKRVLLEQFTLADCLDVLRQARLCSSTNYVLADRDGVVDVETTPAGIARVTAADDVVVHANHFVDPVLAQDDALLPGLPRLRLSRQPAGRADRRTARNGRRRRPMMKMLADHDGYPASICRHEPGFRLHRLLGGGAGPGSRARCRGKPLSARRRDVPVVRRNRVDDFGWQRGALTRHLTGTQSVETSPGTRAHYPPHRGRRTGTEKEHT